MKLRSVQIFIKICLLATITALTLSGCGGLDNEPSDTAKGNFKIFEDDKIYIEYPTDWELITPRDFTVEVPTSAIIAFRNSVRNENFTANISIVKHNLPSERTSIDYAKGLIQKHENELINFKELGRQQTKIITTLGEFDSLITHFSGKSEKDQDTIEFMQVSAVEVKTSYIVTGAFLPDEDEGVKKVIEKSLNSFRVK